MKRKILSFLLAVCIFLFLTGTSVFVTLAFRPLYYHDIRSMDIPKKSGFSEKVIRENYDALIDYNLPIADGKLIFPSFPMSKTAEIHFEEVKDIFDCFKFTAIFAAVVAAVGIAISVKKREYLFLKYTAVVSIGIPVVLGGLTAAFWDKVFILFHELVFDNDYWMFDPDTDPIITILPDEFFEHCALMIVSSVAAGALVCLILYFILGRKKNGNESKKTN